MRKPEWAGAYAGATVVIAASGPSQNADDLDYVRGRALLWVINTTWRLAPWADVLYFCDAAWFQAYGPEESEFSGLKILGKANDNVPSDFCANVVATDRMIWSGVQIGGLHNSGSQCINLLTLWGAARLILTGFDFSLAGGVHWHGPHGRRPNPQQGNVDNWAAFLTRAAPEIKQRGTEVLNASRSTALECFPLVNLRDVL